MVYLRLGCDLASLLNPSDIEELKQRLLNRITIASNGCWVWQGCCGSHEYGQLTFKRRGLLAHRASYEVHCGPIPKGQFVLHHCDNRFCINPDHLYLGSPRNNTDDMIARGRGWLDNGIKLTPEQLIEIKDLALSGLFTQDRIALAYEVAQATVSRIKNGYQRV